MKNPYKDTSVRIKTESELTEGPVRTPRWKLASEHVQTGT